MTESETASCLAAIASKPSMEGSSGGLAAAEASVPKRVRMALMYWRLRRRRMLVGTGVNDVSGVFVGGGVTVTGECSVGSAGLPHDAARAAARATARAAPRGEARRTLDLRLMQ